MQARSQCCKGLGHGLRHKARFGETEGEWWLDLQHVVIGTIGGDQDAIAAHMVGDAACLLGRRLQRVAVAHQFHAEEQALAAHIAGYPQGGIRADRKAALATIGMSLEDGLALEVELCHKPSVAPEAMAGMDSFAKGSRPEPPRQPARTRRSGRG